MVELAITSLHLGRGDREGGEERRERGMERRRDGGKSEKGRQR